MRCGKRRKRKLRKAVRVSEAKSNAEGKKALLCVGCGVWGGCEICVAKSLAVEYLKEYVESSRA